MKKTLAQLSLRSMFIAIAVIAAAVWAFLNVHPFGLLLAVWIFVVGLGLTFKTPKGTMGVIFSLLFFLSMPGLLMCVGVGHPVSAMKLSYVEEGDSKAKVQRLLGRPTVVSKNGTEWTYAAWTWCVVKIHFTDEGVSYVDHDH